MNLVARALLESQAVHIEPNPEHFFTWTSGRRSPIYCDNRQLISYPEFRKQITKAFVSYIQQQHSQVELIAGTATAGISWAAWIADELDLPMVYIRSKPKGHGLKSAIEGKVQSGQKTLIIEDLISTGKSSFEAFEHCQQSELKTLAVMSIFSYGFPEAIAKFKQAGLSLHSLCQVEDLLDYAQEQGQLIQKDCEMILNWRDSF